MKTILEKVKKWLASVRSEIPAFCELCRTATRLVVKTVKKQDSAIEKSAIQELRTRTKNAQIAFGGVLVVLVTMILVRGCEGRGSGGYVTYADDNTRKTILASLEKERQREAQAEIAQREAEAKRAAEEAKYEAEAKFRSQKHEELGAWYKAERKKLDERKKAEFVKLEKSQNHRAHDILVENHWPQIKFPSLDDIIIAVPLPDKYRRYASNDYAEQNCPITIKDAPIFTSMFIECPPAALVDRIRLEGRIPMSVDKAIAEMRAWSERLDESWGVRHHNLGEDQIFSADNYNIASREWEWEPSGAALFGCQVNKTDSGSIAHFCLDIYGHRLIKLVGDQLHTEFCKAVERLEADIKAHEERLDEELQQRQSRIK